MVELAADVAVELPAAGASLPLLCTHEEGRGGELGDPARVVGVEMGHHDGPHRCRVDLPLAKLGRYRLVGAHLEVFEDKAPERPHTLLAVHGHGRVKAGVHQDRPSARVLHQERHHGDLDPFLAGNAHAERLQLAEAPLFAVKVGRRPEHPRAEQRLEPHGGAGLPAWQRQLGGAGLCGDAHARRP